MDCLLKEIVQNNKKNIFFSENFEKTQLLRPLRSEILIFQKQSKDGFQREKSKMDLDWVFSEEDVSEIENQIAVVQEKLQSQIRK